MDRMAVLLNLRDTRDLEFTKLYISRERSRIWNEFQMKINNLSKVNYMPVRQVQEPFIATLNHHDGWILDLVAVIFVLMAVTYYPNGLLGIFMPLLRPLGKFIGIGWLCLSGFTFFSDYLGNVKDYNETRKNNEEANMHNESENARLKANLPQIEDLKHAQNLRDNFWDNELKKVDSLLAKTYNANLIPIQFRHNLAAVHYIYEYMSSAPVTLEHTLISAKLEEGIKRIEAKLDIIINQQQEVIFQLHRLEASNRQLISQNNQMLDSLQRTERNTLEAAQYAQISASYSETTAFFATANYLDSLLS